MADWKVDDILKSDLENYVRQNLKRSEILDYMKRDYVQYKWSLATLDRRLRACLHGSRVTLAEGLP